jgi:hypothetical protein
MSSGTPTAGASEPHRGPAMSDDRAKLLAFVMLVEECLDQQQRYFRGGKQQDDLRKSKLLEDRVRQQIKELRGGTPAPTLF